MSEPSKLTAWERWEMASFDTVEPPPPPQEPGIEETPPIDPGETVSEAEVKLPTAEEIEQIYQQAREDGASKGHEEGYQAGYQQGQAKVQAEAHHLAQAATGLDSFLTELEPQVANELLALSVALAREVIRQEISIRPETLLPVVREALAQLPHQHAAIYLHPDDASLLRSYQGDQLGHAGHRIHEDSKLARGDCLIEAGGSQIDASLAMRWRRVVESLGLTTAWQTDTEADTNPTSSAIQS
jgi:flagellar assembly protein FliH